MSLNVSQLLLTEDRKLQLEAALANSGVPDPLSRCITEAEADVARLTAGYIIDQLSLDGWTRAIALWKAFTIAELGLPDDIEKAYDEAIAELKAIAEGKRPNLPRTEDNGVSSSTGSWGSKENIL